MVAITNGKHLQALSNQSKSLTDEQTSPERLLEVANYVLRQGVGLVDDSLSSDEQLSVTSQYMPGSTIGKHLRHARDHFVLLLQSVSSEGATVLNYDVRLRNTPMETSRIAAREALLETMAELEKVVPTMNMEESVTLQAITPYPQLMQTTFGRELWFAALHAIHHWSMVRVIAGELGIKLEDSFGFAPSTLVHKAQNEQTSS
ncbi:hypothetical protein CERSUDRAFT_79296 [Gelatoporia subvermispora B]|uniref:DinB-like domain-containing protein n=1 Tax=Ceriporiopsis subvermispora (strain B) TaxID=914234 RepID=M2RRX8_CERS8|nr:hypothetical protein CERSUDRAFT_79296 [Gelatoporia subvermispora B]